jgi:Fic family protein
MIILADLVFTMSGRIRCQPETRPVHKARFWEKHATTILNSRQQLMLNNLLDGFEGKMNTSKWAKMTKTSPDTALRDIQDLLNKKVLVKEVGGGRSTNYSLPIIL